MADKPKLDFNPGDTHTFEVVGPAAGKEYQHQPDWNPSYIYDVHHEGRDKSLFATAGLHNQIEREIGGARVGDVLVVTRTGKGTDTRWSVAYARDDAAPRQAPARGAPTGEAGGGESLAELNDGFMTALTFVVENHKSEAIEQQFQIATALFLGSLLRGSVPRSDDSDAEPAGEQPERASDSNREAPHMWVARVLHQAEVHPSNHLDVLNAMLPEGLQVVTVKDVDRRQATALYKLTDGGEDLTAVTAAAATLEDFPPEDDLPF